MVPTDDGKELGRVDRNDESVIGTAQDRAGRTVGQRDDCHALFAGNLDRL